MAPGANARLSGQVTIFGTARHPRFQFYKIEQGQGEPPEAWYTIGEVVWTEVRQGPLLKFDSRGLSNGVYWLRLVVVDDTGNHPPPHQVRVIIAN